MVLSFSFNRYKLSSSSRKKGSQVQSIILKKKTLFTFNPFLREFTTKRFTWLLLPRGVSSLLPPGMKDAHVLLSNIRIEDLVPNECMFVCPHRVCCYLKEGFVASRLG